jgi:hypothetical protein
MKRSTSVVGLMRTVAMASAVVLAQAGTVATALDGPVGDIGALLDQDAATISFQGAFANNGGQPLPGNSVDLEFMIYEVGGVVPVGTVPNASYPMTDGVVQAHLPVLPEWFDGTGRELGVSLDGGPEMSPRIPLTAAPYAFRVHRVASEELDDDIWLGDTDSAGSLCLFGGAHDAPSITADGLNSRLTLFDTSGLAPEPGVELDGRIQTMRVIGNDGLDDVLIQASSFGPTSRGIISLYDAGVANERTVRLSANLDNGGQLELFDTDGPVKIDLHTSPTGGVADFYNTVEALSIQADGPAGVVRTSSAVEVRTALPDGNLRAAMRRDGIGGVFQTWDQANHLTTRVGTKLPGGGIITPGPLAGVGEFQTVNDITGVLVDGAYANNAGGIRIQKGFQEFTTVPMVEIIGDEGDFAAAMNMNDNGKLRVNLDAKSSDGGAVNLYNSMNKHTVQVLADDDINAGEIGLADRDANWSLGLHGDDGNGSRITMVTRSNETLRMDANDGDTRGRISFFMGHRTDDPNPEPQNATLILDGFDQNDPDAPGSEIRLIQNGVDAVRVQANDGFGGGGVFVRSHANRTNVRVWGCGGDDAGNCGGAIGLYDGADNGSVEIDADENGEALVRIGSGNNTSGSLYLYQDSQPNSTIHLNGDTGNARFGNSGQTSGEVFLYSDAGGGATIWLNGDTGNGRFKSVTITGGADLAEPFDVANETGANIEPGMVVSIDPNNPGQLKVSDTPYDRTVAGIISGAGGVNPGMVMGQNGSIANGTQPVALTGRVYVYADATDTPITVGDLLTTSSTPGHAAKASDHTRAQGAIIGKAMTPLAEGRGLVLVLVSLQ